MEDPRVTDPSPSSPGFPLSPSAPSVIDKLSWWRADALGAYQRWLRLLPAGRGPHTEAAEAHYEAALEQLHQAVLKQLGAGDAQIDLRPHCALLNAMPGASLTQLLCALCVGADGRWQVLWPQEFLVAWRGTRHAKSLLQPSEQTAMDAPLPPEAVESDGSEESAESDGLDDADETDDTDETDDAVDSDETDEADESDKADSLSVSTEDDSDEAQALYQARDQQGKLDMLLNHYCGKWFERQERLLADDRRVTNLQWLEVHAVLEKIRRLGGRQALTVELSMQWPPALMISLDKLLGTLREEIAERHLGVTDLDWRMSDPMVPEHMKPNAAHLDLCHFKVAVAELGTHVQNWCSRQRNSMAYGPAVRQLSPEKIQEQVRLLKDAACQTMAALDSMNDGKGAVIDVSAYAGTLWIKGLLLQLREAQLKRLRWLKFGALTVIGD